MQNSDQVKIKIPLSPPNLKGWFRMEIQGSTQLKNDEELIYLARAGLFRSGWSSSPPSRLLFPILIASLVGLFIYTLSFNNTLKYQICNHSKNHRNSPLSTTLKQETSKQRNPSSYSARKDETHNRSRLQEQNKLNSNFTKRKKIG